MQNPTRDIPASPIFQPEPILLPGSAQSLPRYEAIYDVPDGSMQYGTENIPASSVFHSQSTPRPPSAQPQPQYEPVNGEVFAAASALCYFLHPLLTEELDYDFNSCPPMQLLEVRSITHR